jgi:DNA ligase-1
MISFQKLAAVSEKVAATTRKKEKTFLLSGLLQEARGEEIALAASYLSGELPQKRLGVGWAILQQALQGIALELRPLSLVELNQRLDGIAQTTGAGSIEIKAGLLRDLFFCLRKNEREFLSGLIIGEIHQGALEGLVLETVAQASSLPVDHVRERLMFAGSIGEVAKVALEEGLGGLSRFQGGGRNRMDPPVRTTVESSVDQTLKCSID